MVADNRIGDLASWDTDALVAMLTELSATPEQLAGTGFSDADLAELLRAQQAAPEQFPHHGDDEPTEYCCPSCGYAWSGAAKPRSGDEQEAAAS
jgi:hypothetical protein